MKIFNTQVYGLEASMVRSGYPMRTSVGEMKEITDIDNFPIPDHYASIKDFERAQKLGRVPAGSGHDCFLKGIVVQCDIEAPGYWWPQFQRYHFADIISSQATMHSILKFDLKKQMCRWVDQRAIDLAEEYKAKYLSEPTLDNFEALLSNVPRGINLTAGIVTNYLQLKTIYAQRKTHKLKMWREVFCPWVESLPMAKELGVCGLLSKE